MSDPNNPTIKIRVDSSEGHAVLDAYAAKLKAVYEAANQGQTKVKAGSVDLKKAMSDVPGLPPNVVKSFEKAKVSIESITSPLEKVAALIGMEQVLVKAVTDFAAYERGMTRIAQATGSTTAQLEALDKTFQHLAEETGNSTEELQRGFEEFQASSGLALGQVEQQYELVVRAARASGATIQVMSAASSAAIHNLKVPLEEIPAVLDSWTKSVPRALWDSFGRNLPQITFQLARLQLTGKNTAEELGAAFSSMQKHLGEQALPVISSAIEQMTKLSTPLGAMMAGTLDKVREAKGGYVEMMDAMVEMLDKRKLLDLPANRQNAIEEQMRLPPGLLMEARKYRDAWIEIHKEIKTASEAIGEVDTRTQQLNKNLKGSFEQIKGKVGLAIEAIGGMIAAMLGGDDPLKWLKNDIDRITHGAENLRKIFDYMWGKGDKPLFTSFGGIPIPGVQQPTTLPDVHSAVYGSGGVDPNAPPAPGIGTRRTGRPRAVYGAPMPGEAQKFTDGPAGYGQYAPGTGFSKVDISKDLPESAGNIEDRRTQDETKDAQQETVTELKRLNANLEEWMGKGAGGGGGLAGDLGAGSIGGGGFGGLSGGRVGGGGGRAGAGSAGPGTGAGRGGLGGGGRSGHGGGGGGAESLGGLSGGASGGSVQTQGGKVDPGSLYSNLVQKFTDSSLNGYVPPDGAQYGIKTGSPQEWARLGTALASQESSFRTVASETNEAGQVIGNAGLYQFSAKDLSARGMNPDISNPDNQIKAMVGEFEKIKQHGTMTGGPGNWKGAAQYFGPFRRPNEIFKHMNEANAIAARAGATGAGGGAGATPPGGGGLVTHQGSGGMVPPELQQQMAYASAMAGVNTNIAHGMEPGHARHRPGAPAGDIDLHDPVTGRKLDSTNPADREKMSQYITAAAASGATGIGMGGPNEYMGASRMHVGGGTPAVWGDKGAGSNTPGWVRAAYNKGIQNPVTPAQQQAAIAGATSRNAGQPVTVATVTPEAAKNLAEAHVTAFDKAASAAGATQDAASAANYAKAAHAAASKGKQAAGVDPDSPESPYGAGGFGKSHFGAKHQTGKFDSELDPTSRDDGGAGLSRAAGKGTTRKGFGRSNFGARHREGAPPKLSDDQIKRSPSEEMIDKANSIGDDVSPLHHRSLMQLHQIRKEMEKPIDLKVKGPSEGERRWHSRRAVRNTQEDGKRQTRNAANSDIGFA